MRWVPVEGWWPRLVAWACRHRVPAAKAYAAGKIQQEREADRMGALLSACLETGKPVSGTVDENGDRVIRVEEEEDA